MMDNIVTKDIDLYSEELPNVLKSIGKFVPIFAHQNFKDFEFSLISAPDYLPLIACTLKNHINYQYRVLSCISSVDLLAKAYRFLIAYDFLSLTFNSRIRIKIYLAFCELMPSLVYVFINASWWEREIWDLMGISFYDHPDLRRLLTDYGFQGFPLRKDFPLFGFEEVRYDHNQKAVVSESVVLSQEYRVFDYETPW